MVTSGGENWGATTTANVVLAIALPTLLNAPTPAVYVPGPGMVIVADPVPETAGSALVVTANPEPPRLADSESTTDPIGAAPENVSAT